MTAQRDLKRRIRERQRITGERYTTAREQVLADVRRPSWYVELLDVTPMARELGFACPVRSTSDLLDGEASIEELLGRLRTILGESGPELAKMRRAALHGEASAMLLYGSLPVLSTHLRAYFDALAHGVRGPGLDGHLLAFDHEHDAGRQTVLVELLPRAFGPPLLVLNRYAHRAAREWVGMFAPWAGGMLQPR